MNSSHYMILNNLFTRNTVKSLINDQSSEIYRAIVKKFVTDASKKTNYTIISELYQLLLSEYKNEYVYKNTLLNKLLLGVHSTNTTTALSEVPIARSKADFILINGKAVVYEIKSDLDNFERLEGQINDYYKAFNYVAIVTSEDNYKRAKNILNESPVGIYVLTKRNQLSTRKKPIEFNDELDLTSMFKIMRKAEYETLLLNYYGQLPNVSQFDYYKTCLNLFQRIDRSIAYKMFLSALKKRNSVNNKLFNQVPHEIKSLAYFLNLKPTEYEDLFQFLNNYYRG